ncbi:unnamed protein product, partial [Amoebophrya sp. A25]
SRAPPQQHGDSLLKDVAMKAEDEDDQEKIKTYNAVAGIESALYTRLAELDHQHKQKEDHVDHVVGSLEDAE